jgi:hypothetical protein
VLVSSIRLRLTGVVVLVVLGSLLSAACVVAVWARNQVLDTDRYVATVGPLADDPVIRDDVSARVAAAIEDRLDTEALVRRYLPKRSAPLVAPIAAALDQLVAEQASRYVHSEAFRRLWLAANRVGHEQLVWALTGRDSAALSARSGRLTLDLTPVVAAVRQRLAEAGLRPVRRLPPTTLVVDLADASTLQKAHSSVRLLDRVAFWLPIASLLLLAGAVALARRRRRALLGALGGLVLAMLSVHLAVHVGYGVAQRHVPEAAATHDVVGAYYHGLTRLLRRGAAVVGVVAAVAALVVIWWRPLRDLVGGGAVDRPGLRRLVAAATPYVVGGVLLLVW